ncbi:hypothetical protein SNE40_010686 [Patella caerulea]|uniref:Uncharacterized protein n=1 Tax=Patella caerulea TaxID=87958 RepID=A0AAN8JWH5_PATCE
MDYASLFANRLQDIQDIQSLYTELRTKAGEYKLIASTRPRRAILPIVGKALSYLFGTVSQSEFNTIKHNVKKLYKNQESIIHVVDQSLSILNVSRIEISKNRASINSLILNLKQFELQFQGLVANLTNEVTLIKNFLSLDYKLKFILDELKHLTLQCLRYVEYFNDQLNMLSLGHISPSVLKPADLKSLLLEIRSQLPSTVHLSADPSLKLWHYYKFLTCSTKLDVDKIYVILTIPLLDSTKKLEIFYAHNLPAPMQTKYVHAKTPHTSGLVAKYQLESQMFAVNSERTQYVLLTESEVEVCTNRLVKTCSIKSPLYPINLSQLCVIALFMQTQN